MRLDTGQVNYYEYVSLMNGKSAHRTTSPRQRRAFETRAAMLRAVEVLVAQEGWEAVTTTRVAEQADMAVGTVYRYFQDREALLLAAYDESVERLVGICQDALEALPPDTDVEGAARRLLAVYLDAAEAVPSHAGLLKSMRRLRPLDEAGPAEPDQIVRKLVAPFFDRFATAQQTDPLRLHIVGAVLATLVDLYLVGPPESRPMLRVELEAHLLFMLARVAG